MTIVYSPKTKTKKRNPLMGFTPPYIRQPKLEFQVYLPNYSRYRF